MFNPFKKEQKTTKSGRKKKSPRDIHLQIEMMKAKAQLNKAKADLYATKPSEFEKIKQKLEDADELKELVGAAGVTKYLKLLENPVVRGLALKLLGQQGIDVNNQTVKDAINQLGKKK